MLLAGTETLKGIQAFGASARFPSSTLNVMAVYSTAVTILSGATVVDEFRSYSMVNGC